MAKNFCHQKNKNLVYTGAPENGGEIGSPIKKFDGFLKFVLTDGFVEWFTVRNIGGIS